MSIVLDGSNVSTTGVPNRGTAVASTSGTSIDFTGIPAGTKRISVIFSGVSTNGTSETIAQIGSGSFTTTGYVSAAAQTGGTNAVSGLYTTSGFLTGGGSGNGNFYSGILTLVNITGNTWVASVSGGFAVAYSASGGGTVSLSGTLDRVRITALNGTDAFDAGSINILYE